MYYYEVYIADGRYQADEPLTYSSESKLKNGSVVTVMLRGKAVSGFVGKSVNKPTFKTLPIKTLLSDKLIPKHVLPMAEWLRDYYACSLGDGLRQFAINKTVKRRGSAKPEKQIFKIKTQTKELKPTAEQKKALGRIKKLKNHTILLHGHTGSGKTYIYIESIKEALENKKSSIVLVPEIALTAQLVSNIAAQIGIEPVVFHSSLGQAERKRLWLKVLESNEPVVVIGPRSALFVPVRDTGLIIVDETHENTYKQEQTPRYHAVRVASKLAQLTGSKAILGSATPSVVDYYLAFKHSALVDLKGRALKTDQQVNIELIDMKDKSELRSSPYLSKALLSGIEKTLNNYQQALIYLNRRGSARLVMCTACGWQLLCPNCDTPLTYHGDSHKAMCHGCGHNTKPPVECPNCKSPDVIYKSAGTKAIADALAKHFPDHKLARFDGDNKAGERFENQYTAVRDGKIDIIVGTQIVAKGLDLPKLGMVGLVTAETSLYLPDYTADEKTFQSIYQLLGRIGRGHSDLPGIAVIQTYQPESDLLKSAIERDYESFYQHALKERQSFRFPPYSYNLKLVCRRSTEKGAQFASQKLYTELMDKKVEGVQIIGPMPSFHYKRSGSYFWQIIAKSKERSKLVELSKIVPAKWSIDLDPTHLL